MRLAEPLGTLGVEEQQEVCDVLQEMFAF